MDPRHRRGIEGAIGFWGETFAFSHVAGNDLLQHLQHGGRRSFLWLADQQVDMFRHDHVAKEKKSRGEANAGNS